MVDVKEVDTKIMKFDDPELINELDEELYNKLQEDIELLDMAGNNFDLEKVRQGKLSPVCLVRH